MPVVAKYDLGTFTFANLWNNLFARGMFLLSCIGTNLILNFLFLVCWERMYLTLLFLFHIVVPNYFFGEILLLLMRSHLVQTSLFFSCVPLLMFPLTQLVLIQVLTLFTHRSSTITADSEDLFFSKLLGVFEHGRSGKSNKKQVVTSSNMHNDYLDSDWFLF